MKVLLIKDVYKLGRAGDVKKVADGYGRNFLIPQGMAVLATPGALKQADRIRQSATTRRAIVNEEMSVVADALAKLQLTFGARAGETGKLYGSITSQDVADQILTKTGFTVKRQQIDMQPLRTLGEHLIRIRLTMDLIPELKAVVFREGEAEPSLPIEPEEVKPEETQSQPAGETPKKAAKSKAARETSEEVKPEEAEPQPAEEAPKKAKKAKAARETSEEVKPEVAEPQPTEEAPKKAKKAKAAKETPSEPAPEA